MTGQCKHGVIQGGWCRTCVEENKAKPFRELSKDEATELARSCKQGARSEEEIRRRLQEAGFIGTATVTSTRSGEMFMAMVMVWGPRGEVISV